MGIMLVRLEAIDLMTMVDFRLFSSVIANCTQQQHLRGKRQHGGRTTNANRLIIVCLNYQHMWVHTDGASSRCGWIKLSYTHIHGKSAAHTSTAACTFRVLPKPTHSALINCQHQHKYVCEHSVRSRAGFAGWVKYVCDHRAASAYRA